MKFLSLFSGVGGFDLGLERAGMECVGQVEIDPQCRRVLEAHWPDVWRAEDVTKASAFGPPADMSRREISTRSGGDTLPFADVITAGVPCQDWSVAGKRAGIEGERSGLFFEFVRIIREMRKASDGRFPKYALFENVPGLYSAASGRDFGIVLNELVECGAVDIAWRTIDAQHWVPQRRRRVFVVAVFPPASDGRAAIGCAAEILALTEGCAGHPAPGRTPRQDVAGEADERIADTLSVGANQYSGFQGEPVVAKSLRARPNASHRDDNDTYVPELSYALAARNAKGVSLLDGQDTFVVRTAQTGANGIGVSDAAYALDGAEGQAVYAIQERAVSEGTSGPDGKGWREGTAYTLEARHHVQAVAAASVRRLTPVECCRLMGLPDDWLDLDPPLADGPKYRMLGNGVVVPVVEYIGRRIMAVEGA